MSPAWLAAPRKRRLVVVEDFSPRKSDVQGSGLIGLQGDWQL